MRFLPLALISLTLLFLPNLNILLLLILLMSALGIFGSSSHLLLSMFKDLNLDQKPLKVHYKESREHRY